jgi:hypothetical protein
MKIRRFLSENDDVLTFTLISTHPASIKHLTELSLDAIEGRNMATKQRPYYVLQWLLSFNKRGGFPVGKEKIRWIWRLFIAYKKPCESFAILFFFSQQTVGAQKSFHIAAHHDQIQKDFFCQTFRFF